MRPLLKIIKCTIITFLVFLYGSFSLSKSSDQNANYYTLPNNKQILDEVKSQWGLILDPNKYPTLHEGIALIFNDLAKAQEKILESKTAAVNHIHIVQSSEVNAFVWTDFDTGIRVQKNHLFLTTGIIRELLLGSKTEFDLSEKTSTNIDFSDKKNFINKMTGLLSGVIAHEFGHPIDKTSLAGGEGDVSGVSLENHYGRESASQAIEIKADIMGMKILRMANYPTDTLYNSLLTLFGDTNKGSLFGAMSSTHPHLDFRLSSARLYLAIDRLNHGLISKPKAINLSDSDVSAMASELDKVEEKRGRYPYKKPKNISEIAERLTTISKVEGNENFAFNELEFNRLLLSFDHLLLKLQKAGQELTAEEKETFKEILNIIYKIMTRAEGYREENYRIFNLNDLRASVNKKSGISGLEYSPTHYYFLENLKIYQSKEVEEVVKNLKSEFEQLNPTRGAHWGNSFSFHLFALASVSDPEIFFKNNHTELEHFLQKVWVREATPYYNTGTEFNIFLPFGILFQSKFIQLGIDLRESMQFVPFAWKIYKNSISSLWSPIPLIEDFSEINRNPLLTLYRQGKLLAKTGKHPEIEESVKVFRENCKQIWELRGFYGASEILFNQNKIDWNLIIEVLDLDQRIAFNQIERAVVKYMNGKTSFEQKGIPSFNKLLLIATNKSDITMDKKGHSSWLVWNSKNLSPHILNAPLQNNDSVQEIVNAKLLKTSAENMQNNYRLKEKSVFTAEYHNEMTDALNEISKNLTNMSDQVFLNNIAKRHVKFFSGSENISHQTSVDSALEIKRWNSSYLLEKQISLIMNSDLPIEKKKRWFEALFLRPLEHESFSDRNQPIAWEKFISSLSSYEINSDRELKYMGMRPLNEQIITAYNQLFQSNILEMMLILKEPKKVIEKRKIISRDSSYFAALAASEKPLQEYFKSIKPRSVDEFMRWVSLVVPLSERKTLYELEYEESKKSTLQSVTESESAYMNANKIQRIKNTLLEVSKSFKLIKGQKLDLFLRLTESGPTRMTDELFKEIVDLNNLNQKSRKLALQALDEGRISTDSLKLEAAKLFIGERVNKLTESIQKTKTPVDRWALNQLIEDLNRYAPNGSLKKDHFLEKIGISLQLKGSELDGFIEDQKYQNWRKANPMLIRVGSLLASHIQKLSSVSRISFINYLIDPINNDTSLFTDIFDELKKISYNELLNAVKESDKRNHSKMRELEQKAERMAEILKLKAEEAIRDSTPAERIPLFEVTLTSGPKAPINSPDWPTNITRQFLKHKPGSVEEAIFLTFLEVLPKAENSIALAYMLSLANDKSGSNVAELFKVFGTVGIKFGQLISIWKIFGEDLAEKAKHLKNDAGGLSRAEIMSLAYERHHEIRSLIAEFNNILGSASVKTTTRVTLTDGRQGAFALQGEHVAEIIEMNVKLGKEFIEKLKQKSVIKNSLFMINLIEALEEQLISEIDMKEEVKKTLLTKKIIQEIESELKSELKEWKLNIPSKLEGTPSGKNFVFNELVSGTSFENLTEGDKAAVGEIVVKVKIKMLFKYGYFDPDRHSGNIIIDAENKVIHFIDFGQLENFMKSSNPIKYDPRLVLAQFLVALSDLNAKNIVYYANLMSRTMSLTPVQEKVLADKIEKRLSKFKTQTSKNYQDLMSDIIIDLGDGGIKFATKYIFGGLKGLIILFGEKYVSESVFRNILTSEVKNLLIKKSPAIIAEKIGFIAPRDHLTKEKDPIPPKSTPNSCKSLFR